MQKEVIQKKFELESELKKKQQEEKQGKEKIPLQPAKILQRQDLEVKKEIGSGGSAKVYRAKYKQIDVAIKRLMIGQQIDLEKALQEYKREVQTLCSLQHPNLVLFIGVLNDQDNLCIVTEYCKGGSLFQLLHQSPDI